MNRSVVQELLEEYGEVIVTLSSGSAYELHQHDVEFKSSFILIDKDEEIHTIDYDSIGSADVHESGPV